MLAYIRDGSAQTSLRAATQIQVADPTFYLTQSQYTDTGPTSPSADPIMPGTWQGIHWSANFEVTGMTRHGKFRLKRDSNPGSSAPEANYLTNRPARRFLAGSRATGALFSYLTHSNITGKSLSRQRPTELRVYIVVPNLPRRDGESVCVEVKCVCVEGGGTRCFSRNVTSIYANVADRSILSFITATSALTASPKNVGQSPSQNDPLDFDCMGQ